MEISSYKNADDTGEVYVTKVNRFDIAHYSDHIGLRVMELVAQSLATQFLEKHGTEILGRMSADAIATMTVAEAGAAVNETLHKKMPDKILEIERSGEPIVLQRGIFGGVKRLR